MESVLVVKFVVSAGVAWIAARFRPHRPLGSNVRYPRARRAVEWTGCEVSRARSRCSHVELRGFTLFSSRQDRCSCPIGCGRPRFTAPACMYGRLHPMLVHAAVRGSVLKLKSKVKASGVRRQGFMPEGQNNYPSDRHLGLIIGESLLRVMVRSIPVSNSSSQRRAGLPHRGSSDASGSWMTANCSRSAIDNSLDLSITTGRRR